MALRAGVSPVTVSRVLRDPDKVSEALRSRVNAAVRELAYVPNQLASALASARTGRVAVIVPSFTNGVFDDYLKALHDIFVPAGLHVLVSNSRYLVNEEKAIATLLGQHPEAMIVAGIDQTAQARHRFGRPASPSSRRWSSPTIRSTSTSASRITTPATPPALSLRSRLPGLGHIAAPLDSALASEWLDTCAPFGKSASHPRSHRRHSPSTVALGGSLLGGVDGSRASDEALFCCNDDLALGVLFECQRQHIRVPDDLSIIGFNDLEFCASAHPSLSSVATPRYAMAQRAAEIVLEIIRGSERRPERRQIDLGFRVVERASTSERMGAAAVPVRI